MFLLKVDGLHNDRNVLKILDNKKTGIGTPVPDTGSSRF